MTNYLRARRLTAAAWAALEALQPDTLYFVEGTGDTCDFYVTDNAGTPTAYQVNPGPGGTDGATILTGSAAPDNGAGANGDLYINTANGDLYVKASGIWGAPAINLKGPAGADGTSGTNGLGWTGATYNAATGRVSFASDDGLDFETGDLRGAPGTAADAYAVILTPDAAETAIAEGYYTCTMRARASGTFANFFAILTHGASGDEVQVSVAKNGTIDAGVLVGAAIVHGPVTVAYGSPVTTGSLSIAVAAGDAIHFLVEGVTGAPFGGQFQIDGAA